MTCLKDRSPAPSLLSRVLSITLTILWTMLLEIVPTMVSRENFSEGMLSLDLELNLATNSQDTDFGVLNLNTNSKPIVVAIGTSMIIQL